MTLPSDPVSQAIIFWAILLFFAYLGYRQGRRVSLFVFILILMGYFLFINPLGRSVVLRTINTSWKFSQIFIQVLQNGGSLAGIKAGSVTDILPANAPYTPVVLLFLFLAWIWLVYTLTPKRVKGSPPALEGALIGLVTGYALLVILAPVFNIRVAGPGDTLIALGNTLTTGVATSVLRAPTPAPSAGGNVGTLSQSAQTGKTSVLRVPTPLPPSAATATAAMLMARTGGNPALVQIAPQFNPTVSEPPPSAILGVLPTNYLVIGAIVLILFLVAMALNPARSKR